jgi:Leucine-rich repeat (LRR) protein
VDVASNKLTSLPAEMSKLVNVESIFAYGNQLTSLPDLSTLPLLTLLNVSENPLTELPQNLPKKCKIYSDLNKDEDN